MKLLLTTVTTMKWRSDSPVSIAFVSLKHCTLLVSIKSIQRELTALKQVGSLSKLAIPYRFMKLDTLSELSYALKSPMTMKLSDFMVCVPKILPSFSKNSLSLCEGGYYIAILLGGRYL